MDCLSLMIQKDKDIDNSKRIKLNRDSLELMHLFFSSEIFENYFKMKGNLVVTKVPADVTIGSRVITLYNYIKGYGSSVFFLCFPFSKPLYMFCMFFISDICMYMYMFKHLYVHTYIYKG